jgi:cullin 3
MYMDRTYVNNFNKTPVHELGLNLWRDNIVRSSKIKDRLLDMLLDLVHRERTGEMINRGLM